MLGAVTLFFATACVAGSALGDDSPTSNEPLEPKIAEASTEGSESIASFRLPPGWKIELFASEPDVANVVAFDIDNLGRIFACETFRQNRGVTDNRGHDEVWLKRDLASQTVQDRIDYHRELLGDEAKTYTEQDDRIRLLVDTDGDGKADSSSVYASHFNQLEDGTGAGVLARGKDVYFTNIPKLYNLVDSNGDGKADERLVLSDGFGVRVAFRGHDMHGLVLGPDGLLYFSIGDRGYHVLTEAGKLLHDPASGAVFRCELDGSNLEVFAKGLRNPQELAFNDYGDLFTGDNNSDSGDKARLVHVLQGGDTGWRMYYQYLPDRGPFNREKIWEPFHDEQPAYIVPPIVNFGDGPSGLTFYPGTGFGDELKDNFLLADFRGGPSNSGIRSFRLEPEGSFYKLAEDAEKVWSVLATDVAFGPDGGLYISDWVNGWNGEGKGRIYRLSNPEHSASEVVKEVSRLLGGNWSTYQTDALASLLLHPDRRVRFEAQWELASRGDSTPLLAIALDAEQLTIPRLHAVWGLQQIARKAKSAEESIIQMVRELLGDSDPYVRAIAAQFAGQHSEIGAHETLVSLLADDSSRVRYFAALAIADLKYRGAIEPITQMLADNDNRDPALRHAGIMALTSIADSQALVGLVGAPSANVRRAVVVALRNQGVGSVSRFLIDGDARVVAEAARAIHDSPITDGMPALAALIVRPLQDEQVIRRVLNANFRLGTPENANALARYAGLSSAPEAMRLEALSMLGDWESPDERDRVLNDWRPLPSRDANVAKDALQANLASILSGSEQVRSAAISLAAEMGLNEVTPLLARRLDDTSLAADTRAVALRAMGRLDSQQAIARSRELLADLEAVAALRVAAVETLATLVPGESIDQLIDSTTENHSIAERQAAWDAMANIDSEKTDARLAEGVRLWLAGDLATETSLNLLEAAESRKLQDSIAGVEAKIKQQSTTDPLAAWLVALKGGNPTQGETIFFTKTELSCVRCHKVGAQGGEVGPVLTQIGKEKDSKYLLEAIVYPEAQIAKGYETTVIADDLGTVHTGIVKQENEDFIDLIKADGSQVRVIKDEIVGRRRGQSAMPADLTKYMTKRELRDLVAYLKTLDKPMEVPEEGHAVE
jgi:quinoprotein glucose dehydrogenase